MVWFLSVCLSHSSFAAVCGRFAAVGPAGRKYQSTDFVTNCISKENNDIIFVCSSLCVSIYFHQVLSYLTFDVDLCVHVRVWVGHYHS